MGRVPSRRKGSPVLPVLTIVTGLAGAGRTEAAHALEDLGYFVIDNLPPALLNKMVELSMAPGREIKNVALVVDLRSGPLFDELAEALRDLSRRGVPYRIVFLTASDEVLVRRFEGSKRLHPLGDRLVESIAKERGILESLREAADLVIDTSALNVHQLRDRIVANFASDLPEERMSTTVMSFGFKYGIPLDADMVLDVRFLANPHWEDELRPHDGREEIIRDFVLGKSESRTFLERLGSLMDVLVPGFITEGKRYLTIAIGCTGGRHRSVVIAEELATSLRERGVPAVARHRDVDRE